MNHLFTNTTTTTTTKNTMNTDTPSNIISESIDTGALVFNIRAEHTRKGTFFTCYSHPITVRSKLLEIDRVLDTFIDMALMACGLDEEGKEDDADRVEEQIRKFVNRALEEL